MNIISVFKDVWLKAISGEPNAINLLLQIIGIIVGLLPIFGGIICFIDSKIVSYSKSEKNQAKRLLKEHNHHISSILRIESVFFAEHDPRKLLFYRDVPIKKYRSRKKTCLHKLIVSKYLLLGSAGSGKSAIIKKDYLYHCNKFINFWHIRTGYVYINRQFLNHGIQGLSSLEEIIGCVEKTKYKKIYLYIDGIDEFGECGADEIFRKMKSLSRKIKKVKITSRTNFAVQNIINHDNGSSFGFKEKQRYIVENWNEKQLIKLASCLVKHLGKDKTQTNKFIDKIKEEKEKWKSHIEGPLLMKLYLYIVIYGDENKKINFDNKYLFYTQFVTEVILTQRKRKGNFNSAEIQTELDGLSASVFKVFSKNDRHICRTENIEALLKPSEDKFALFVHETFFEYFVARNYLLQLSKKHLGNDTIAALHQTYTNDFADFITSALNSTNEVQKKQILDALFTVYYLTLDENIGKDYMSRFNYNRINIDSSNGIRKAVRKLSKHQFFTLKYEIVFRLGRIDIVSEEIADFLSFVYNCDENIGVSEKKEYYVAVLKRCCAISCSFLGSEQIELDYVKKMIPCNKSGVNNSYVPDYDLANRSHTLLFYGDVVKVNIFEFRDDATNNPFALAFAKRIKRLKTDLPEYVNAMDKGQKKKYYFRLFDLATIYTFMFNRRKPLTDEELKIVSKTRVQFIGASDERNSLMQEILNLILTLNGEL